MGNNQKVGFLVSPGWIAFFAVLMLGMGFYVIQNFTTYRVVKEVAAETAAATDSTAAAATAEIETTCGELEESLTIALQDLQATREENQLLNRRIAELGVTVAKLTGTAEDVAKAQYQLHQEIVRQREADVRIDSTKKSLLKKSKSRRKARKTDPIEELELELDTTISPTPSDHLPNENR